MISHLLFHFQILDPFLFNEFVAYLARGGERGGRGERGGEREREAGIRIKIRKENM